MQGAYTDEPVGMFKSCFTGKPCRYCGYPLFVTSIEMCISRQATFNQEGEANTSVFSSTALHYSDDGRTAYRVARWHGLNPPVLKLCRPAVDKPALQAGFFIARLLGGPLPAYHPQLGEVSELMLSTAISTRRSNQGAGSLTSKTETCSPEHLALATACALHIPVQ